MADHFFRQGPRRHAGLPALLILGVFIALAIAGMPAFAQNPAAGAPTQAAPPMFDNPALEARVIKIAEELRCLVCQNETIAASHADLAVDLRRQIRLKLQEGQSQRQILDFMVQRYGDFVLYRPPLKASTVMLWVGPFILLLVAGTAMAINIRKRRRSAGTQTLSPEQARRARQLLEESETKS